MYRVQLWLKVSDAREEVLLGSWTCPDEEHADKKETTLKNQYKDNNYIVKKFKL